VARRYDVIIVGSGNAALCAAIAAGDAGAEVLILEVGGEEHFGGNSRYTAAALRFAFPDPDALRALLVDCDDPRLSRSDFGTYPVAQFAADLAALNGGAALNGLQRGLVEHSYDTVAWLVRCGLRLEPIYDRQAFVSRDRYRFWGGVVLAARGAGEGLVAAEREFALTRGAELRLNQRVVSLRTRAGAVVGVHAEDRSGIRRELESSAVVLACGGFEANAALRSEHLGTEWRHAVVRGTPLNQGDGLAMARAVGADTAGDFSGCHAVCMDVATPTFDRSAIPHHERVNFRKISYPFGIMLNAEGRRFVDEGADFRNYTYAQYGREVLKQPGAFAWQVFDRRAAGLLYEEYRMQGATRVEARTLEQLVARLDGVDPRTALATLREYNAAAAEIAAPFDPSIRDGRATQRLAIPKSNWALPLREPPFEAFRVTCGVTFTYGGLRIRPDGAVLRADGVAIPGLFAAGEIVGGLFSQGYPGGAGLTAGAVYGRAAGTGAARPRKAGPRSEP